MATLKYRKSRKNKKQLKKKKRTYKKRKTTRRKKGGTVEVDNNYGREQILPDKTIENTINDFKHSGFDKSQIKLDDIKDEFIKSDNIDYQLYLLKKIVADGNKISCSGILTRKNTKNYVSCQKKKVHDYCTIIKKVDEILETKLKDDHRTEFNERKEQLEKKVEDHMISASPQKNKNDLPITSVFTCGNILKYNREEL
jgi:hypothetical protein